MRHHQGHLSDGCAALQSLTRSLTGVNHLCYLLTKLASAVIPKAFDSFRNQAAILNFMCLLQDKMEVLLLMPRNPLSSPHSLLQCLEIQPECLSNWRIISGD